MSSNYEIAELTWKNGQLGMNGLGGLLQTKSSTHVWEGQGQGMTSETLESIVHQATFQNHSGEVPSGHQHPVVMRKRTRSESDYATLSVNGSNCMELREVMSETNNNNNMSTCWANNSFDSSPSFKHNNNNKATFDDSASLGGSENQDGDGETTRTETVKSGSSRRSRAASVHNQSERRRRDRINQKMKALQKLVPNASKTDKASMLDEVIEYLKQLQAQVQLMSSVRNNMNIPAAAQMNMNMIMSLGLQQQQQLHMSLLAARMGMQSMGIGIGMPPASNPTTTTSFLPPPFLLPSLIHHPHPPPPPPPPPAQLQSMNMEVYNKMAQLYQQHQVNQTTHRSNQ